MVPGCSVGPAYRASPTGRSPFRGQGPGGASGAAGSRFSWPLFLGWLWEGCQAGVCWGAPSRRSREPLAALDPAWLSSGLLWSPGRLLGPCLASLPRPGGLGALPAPQTAPWGCCWGPGNWILPPLSRLDLMVPGREGPWGCYLGRCVREPLTTAWRWGEDWEGRWGQNLR